MDTPKIAIFSDLHLSKHRHPAHEKIFVETLAKLRDEDECDELWLLGDIFDMMVGPFDFWKKLHPEFFAEIHKWVILNKKITWIQGNHDFYLEEFLTREFITVSDNDLIKHYGGCPYYLAHGDLVDKEDQEYMEWRRKTRSPFFRNLLKKIPFKSFVITAIGDALSKKSRKKSSSYDNSSKFLELKNLFREFSSEKWGYGVRGIFLGHSHVDDLYISEEKNQFYLNLGTWLDGAPRYAIWDVTEYSYPVVIKIPMENLEKK